MLTDDDLTRISGVMRSAGFHLVSADLSDGRELQVTVSAQPSPLAPKGPTKRAASSYVPERAIRGGGEAIPWAELNEREKFAVLGAILAILRQ